MFSLCGVCGWWVVRCLRNRGGDHQLRGCHADPRGMHAMRYRSTAGVEGAFRKLMLLCVASCVCAVGLIGLDVALVERLHPGEVMSDAYLTLTDLARAGVDLALTASVLFGVPVLFAWISLTVANTEALAQSAIRSERWAWVWFFVPGPCLYKPIAVMSELLAINRFGLMRVKGGYSRRRNASSRELIERKPFEIAMWWYVTLLGVALVGGTRLLGLLWDRLALGIPVEWLAYAELAGYVSVGFAGVMGAMIVGRIGRAQREWYDRIPKSEPTERSGRRAVAASPLRSAPGEAA